MRDEGLYAAAPEPLSHGRGSFLRVSLPLMWGCDHPSNFSGHCAVPGQRRLNSAHGNPAVTVTDNPVQPSLRPVCGVPDNQSDVACAQFLARCRPTPDERVQTFIIEGQSHLGCVIGSQRLQNQPQRLDYLRFRPDCFMSHHDTVRTITVRSEPCRLTHIHRVRSPHLAADPRQSGRSGS